MPIPTARSRQANANFPKNTFGLLALAAFAIIGFACGPDPSSDNGAPLVLYSGRSESLVGPLIEEFERESGIEVDVRWGSTSELAATLLEEGANSPADVFFAQDPGGLGAVLDSLAPLPEDILSQVEPGYHEKDGRWVGISGRARTLVYNTENLQPADLPDSLEDLTDPRWQGRIGWAPTNASLQTMVTAMRSLWGEPQTRDWLVAFLENDPLAFDNNTAVVAAVGAGEVDLGLVNHYYLYRFLAEEGEGFPARNHYIADGGPGSIVMVAGAGRLASSENTEQAEEFIRFLLSSDAQAFFASETSEYPLAGEVDPSEALPPLDELNPPQVNLSDLADLRGTIELLQEVGALP